MKSIGGFNTKNCSFERCFAQHVYNEKVTTSGANPVIFSDCLFNCRSNDNGGAIFHNITSSLTFIDCAFVECRSELKGGVLFTGYGYVNSDLTINNSYAINCSAKQLAGFSHLDYQMNLILSKVNYTRNHGEMGGGAVYLNRYVQNNTISECLFLECDEGEPVSNLGGGGLMIGDSKNIIVSDCGFFRCEAKFGGGINFAGDGTYGGDWTSLIKFCYFEDNLCREDGKDVSFKARWVSHAKKEIFIECRSMTEGNRRVVNGDADVSDWIFNGSLSELHLDGNAGIDHKACGKNERKCRTMQYAVEIANEFSQYQTKIVVENDVLTEGECKIGEKIIEIEKGVNGEATIVSKTILSSLFYVSSGSLSMSLFSIVRSSSDSSADATVFHLSGNGNMLVRGCKVTSDIEHNSDNKFRTSVAVFEGGTVEIEDTSISSFWLDQKSCISFGAECCVRMKNCTIEKINVNDGNGGGIEGSIGEGCCVEMVGCSMKNCNVYEGNGGGMLFFVSGGGSLLIGNETEKMMLYGCASESSRSGGGYGGGMWICCKEENTLLTLSHLTFNANRAIVGKDMFLKCHSLIEIVNSSSCGWASLIEQEDRNNSLRGIDDVWFQEKDEDLFYLILGYKASMVFVSSTKGMNHIGCGQSVFECRSVDYGVNRIAGEGELCVKVNVNAHIEQEFIIDNIGIESINDAYADLRIKIGEEKKRENIVEVKDGTLRKLNLQLNCTTPVKYKGVISHCFPDSLLTVANCRFVCGEDSCVAESIFVISDGIINFEYCCFFLIPLIKSALVINSALQVPSEENSVRSVLMDSCDIESMSGRGESACVMESHTVENIQSILVKNSTITECSSEKSRFGGSFFVAVCDRTTFEMNESKVVRCGTKVGKGGGIYIEGIHTHEEILPILFSNVNFRKNEAIVGRDIFVVCELLRKQINESQFLLDFREPPYDRENAIWGTDSTEPISDVDLIPLIVTYRNELIFVNDVSNESADVNPCGQWIQPCASLGYGLGHIIPSGYSQVIVVSETAVGQECECRDVAVRSGSMSERSKVKMEEKFKESSYGTGTINCCGSVKFEKIDIMFLRGYESTCEAVILIKDGQSTFSMSSFGSLAEIIELTEAVIEVKSGSVVLIDVSFELLSTRNSVIVVNEACSFQANSVNIHEINSTLSFITAFRAIIHMDEMEITRCLMNESIISTVDSKVSLISFECNSSIVKTFISSDSCNISFEKICIKSVEGVHDLISIIATESKISIKELDVRNFKLQSGSAIELMQHAQMLSEKLEGYCEVEHVFMSNVTSMESYACGMAISSCKIPNNLANCSFLSCSSLAEKGRILAIKECTNVTMSVCEFDGEINEEVSVFNHKDSKGEDICQWNESIIDNANSSISIIESIVENGKSGGLSAFGGFTTIKMGMFVNNNPLIPSFKSARRNIVCRNGGVIDIASLKGGDGLLPGSSLWILNDGCLLRGIVKERTSAFFIPVLDSVELASISTDKTRITFLGKYLIPCNLSMQLQQKNGKEEVMIIKMTNASDFVSENVICSDLHLSELPSINEETEISACLLFGNADAPSSTDSFILKNRSEPKIDENERIVEGGKEGKSYWLLIVIIMAFVLLVILIVAVISTVRWRKQKKRTEELEVIVENTVRKDPKAFEMVTMEISPEEQWRRAEREAEKKNDERMKKRVYAKSLGHSESSEHLLSESGSTEYILGKDSDKIPDWALEKEEEEEIRKQTPSPSISSTSTTDSDSTFVRGEDLCPTTSSMSNLVDAMACSSPHEKLIVDLRDSLFMLLHGRNKTKEMPIGSLKEREQTAAQILFWVANGAIHSFDEMENPLQSLANLSPHIVLFSEHMVICIVMHSDFSSDDDSDSSSISSSTVATSASDDDDDDRDSLPSSAFEDEDDNKKECLRWKAPELQMNKKMGATKKSVVFSIGMMLWECLTLQIPFGEYEAVIAGDKIAKGERPDVACIRKSTLSRLSSICFSQQNEQRPNLADVKRELIQRFPSGAVMFTMSDAIDNEPESGGCISEDESGSASAFN
ncbi:uncharacterized protein MONOS_6943 [Monocercomonoides exilis]|uniref:uncharacterized protein n=1 Tax=Monocercomonoides exilis TaxID=2049356 RepID=UPI00355A217E|nr:hypothetical protein MONOS_6943 [Monocercomonoides exilis]|eukprot:MONOS_6943.1-p1 / transcript=MONOS_6943.1 / gene=MONOS_6943 / organism=Monocercomonoides_exilis_PA203 / gene_product=unspecified product / transcript_product=unspecified product / location=Mono_scaffold00228:34453-40551(-) / protein_length=2032 / sequence_SO=supercontig / SO=protein_coding / is_pseudo=false